jgi:hypothetical protein
MTEPAKPEVKLPAHLCERRLFPEPDNKNIRIWRFMGFTKLVAMLEYSGLYFNRCDLFDDRFEGSITQATRDAFIHRIRGTDQTSEGLEKLASSLSDLNRWFREWTFVNCWHMNEHESAAMWKLYSQTSEAIAIVSTYSRLRSCLNEDFWIEQVRYIDYATDVIPEGNAMYPFVFKRKSFAHERELRAFICDLPTKDHRLDIEARPAATGKWVWVDLNALIECVHVAPSSRKWFSQLVSDVGKRYGLRVPIKQSSLDQDPVF